MAKVCLFVEDQAHKLFLDALVRRLADESQVEVELQWRNARRGHGAVIRELKQFFRDMGQGQCAAPDLVVIATDANCKGLVDRLREVREVSDGTGIETICAVPDPHIERWMLVDGRAFKQVFGRGCDAPDQKCERDRYKKMLVDSILKSGLTPGIGGFEFAGDIVSVLDLDRAGDDASLKRLIADLRVALRKWRT